MRERDIRCNKYLVKSSWIRVSLGSEAGLVHQPA
jgi:hypothetical protein